MNRSFFYPLFKPYLREAIYEIFGNPHYKRVVRKVFFLEPILNVIFLLFSVCCLFGAVLYLIYLRSIFRNEISRVNKAAGLPAEEWPTGALLRHVDKEGIESLLTLNEPSLEIGIESGKTSHYIFDKQDFTFGVEYDPNYMPCFSQDSHWGLRIVADANDLPFKTGTIKTIVLVHVINNIRDVRRIFSECARILKDDGQIVLTCYGPGMLEAGPWGSFLPIILPVSFRRFLNNWMFLRLSQFHFNKDSLIRATQNTDLVITDQRAYWNKEASRMWATLHYGFFRRNGLFYLNLLKKIGLSCPAEMFKDQVNKILSLDMFMIPTDANAAGEIIYKLRKK